MSNSSTIEWLLEDKNPSIKYRTLTEILGKPLEDEEVQATYNLIWQQKIIQKILNKLDGNGVWATSDFGGFTSLRYLTALAEHGLSCDKRIENSIEFAVNAINATYEEENAHITKSYGGCANALTLRAIVMLGYHNRSDVKELINKYISSQLYDGGFMCKRLLDKKPERKSCYKASLAALLLYASCKQKGITFDNSSLLIEYFLKRDVFYSSDKSNILANGRAGWRFIDNFFPVEPMRIGLPLIISSLCLMGAWNNNGMEKAWTFLQDKKNSEGRLILEGTLTKQPCSFGKVGQENKWLTFYSTLSDKYN